MSGPEQGSGPSVRVSGKAVGLLANSRFWRSPTFWIIVAVNVALAALYLWSRGGSTTEVRFEAIGSNFRTYVDGKPISDGQFDASGEGGIGFTLTDVGEVPSLPSPRGIDHVKVTSSATGEVLFEDSFDPPSDIWKIEGGNWHTDDGVYTAEPGGTITTGPQPWTNYVVEARFRNVTEASVLVRASDSQNGVAFALRPYQHYDSLLVLIAGGQQSGGTGGAAVELDRGQTVQSITAMLLRPYPTALLMIAGAVLLALIVRVAPLELAMGEAGRAMRSIAPSLVAALGVSAAVLLWYINYVVGDHIPHVPDEVVFLWTAKMFASFQITADAPPVRDSFSFFYPPFQHVQDGRYFGPYPFGHSLFLAVGQLFHAVWLVPPLVGAGSIALIYALGKRVYQSTAVGLIAAVLLFFSPFFQMTASNFMSHSTAAFAILACLFLYALPTKRRYVAMFFSGIFLGLVFNIRPLTAVTLIPALGLFMGYELMRAGPNWRKLFTEDLAFGAGALLMLFAYFFYNHATTGSFTQSPYEYSGALQPDTFGFGGAHTVALGIQNEQVLLALLLLVIDGWPLFVGLLFAALPFVLGTRHRWDYLLATCGLAVAATMMYFPDEAIMHGPRYWYESMPFLILLSARGIVRLRDAGSAAGDWLARAAGWAPNVSSGGVTSFAMVSLVAGLVAFSSWGWMLEKRDLWPPIEFTPRQISELEGFNFTDTRLIDRADDLDLKNALILVEPCSQWWCYGSVFWLNNVDLDGNVVWARRLGDQNDLTLLEHYRGRNLYSADYDSGTIRPTTEDAITRQVPQAPEGEPEPTPVEPGTTPEERDQTRREHLEQIRAALEQYGTQHGGYPTTGGQSQTLCVYQDLDAGCALAELLPVLPAEPLGSSPSDGYWYWSDGVSFVVIAQLEATDEQPGQCPEKAGRAAGDRKQYCVEGSLPDGATTPPPG